MSVQLKRRRGPTPNETPNSELASATPYDDGRMVDSRFPGDMTPDGCTLSEDRYQGVRSPCHSALSNTEDDSTSSDDETINLADFDEVDAEDKRKEYEDDMFELTQHFSSARELLLSERLASLEESIALLKDDTLPEYVKAVERFRADMTNQLENTETWKKLHIENLNINAGCERVVVEKTVKEERELLLYLMREELNNTIVSIQKQREALKTKRAKLCDPNVGDLVKATIEAQMLSAKKLGRYSKRQKPEKVESKDGITGNKANRRRVKSPQEDQPNQISPIRHRLRQNVPVKSESFNSSGRHHKPTLVSGPYIVYMLREQDILDDWGEICQAIKIADQRHGTSSHHSSLMRRQATV